jgi:hypothetical protein
MRRSWTKSWMLAAALSMGATAAPGADESSPSSRVASEMCAANPSAARIQVLVELADTPALAVYRASLAASTFPDPAQKEASARTAERAQDRRIKEAQASVGAALAGLGARELYRVRRSFNGIAVAIGSDKLDALRTLAGVKAIYPRTDARTDASAPAPRQGAEASASKQSPQPANTGFPAASGLRAYVDPTGRLTSSPTDAQVNELDRLLGDPVNQSSEGLEVVTHADGSEVVVLHGRFQNYSTATLTPGGGVRLRCNGHAASGPPSPGPSAAPEKE